MDAEKDGVQSSTGREVEGVNNSPPCERGAAAGFDWSNRKESPCGTLFFPGSLPSTPEVGHWTDKVYSRTRRERLPEKRERALGRERAMAHVRSTSASVDRGLKHSRACMILCAVNNSPLARGTKRPLEPEPESPLGSPDDFQFAPRISRASVGAPPGAEVASPTWLALDLSGLSIARPVVVAQKKIPTAPVAKAPITVDSTSLPSDSATVPIWKRRCLSRPRTLIVSKPILA